MLILGIDPGSRKAGFGLIQVVNRKYQCVATGCLNYNPDTTFIDRLGEIYKSCENLITQYNPDEIAIESLIYVKSPTALMKLSQARGAMIAALMKTHRERVFEYSPNLIKASVCGHGHASKEGIQKSLKMIFGSRVFKSHDESDALAIALCHGLHIRTRMLKKSTGRIISNEAAQ